MSDIMQKEMYAEIDKGKTKLWIDGKYHEWDKKLSWKEIAGIINYYAKNKVETL